ncbi:type II/IV secretion system protein [Patescibacteria group bacterium]|nr:type II/IV secretion system protein [Patescibacteria group bacterium]
MNILETLIQRSLLLSEVAANVQKEATQSQKLIEEVLLEKKLVEEELLFSIKSEILQIPLKSVEPKDIPLKVLELIPEDAASHYRMVPLTMRQGVVEIGMIAPEDVKAKEALNFLSRQKSFSFQVALLSVSQFAAVMRHYRNQKNEISQALGELQEEFKDEKDKSQAQKLTRLVEEAPVTKMVAVILRNAVEGKASDIHIEPTKDKLRVRFRMLGDLYSSLFLPKRVHQSVVSRIKILSNLKIDEQRIPQDGRFSAVINERSIDFRVSTFPTVLGEKVAIRVLDPELGLKGFDELGLEGSNLEKVQTALKRPFGLILVTGPTGSGKTTTLYAMLQSINKESLNIVSLEDPVEYLLEGVNQSQIRPDIQYNFAQGLRQVLRQDPDVIMVGEVRDKETASLVVHAALTGHIVLSTLHANNAAGVIPRLLDMGVDKYLVPATLSIAISQRLVRRLCDNCKERVEPKREMKELILGELRKIPLAKEKSASAHLATKGKDINLFVAKGCKECGASGYTGRIGLFEVLVMTDELSDIILQTPSEANIAKEGIRQGMITLRQDGVLKAIDGITTIEEVIRVTEE